MATRTQRLIVFALVAIPAAVVVGYRHYVSLANEGQPNWLFPEKAELVPLQPASQSLADRTRFVIQKNTGQDIGATTLPVSVTAAGIELGRVPQSVTDTQKDHELDVHVGEMHGDVDAVSGTAYLVRYANNELCEGDVCPMALVTRKQGPEQVGEIILSTRAKNIWVSNVKSSGNPDLIVDYGVPGVSPTRLYWREDGQYPVYTTAAPPDRLNMELPELPVQ